MMLHDPGLAASPPVRNNLEVGERNISLPFRFSVLDRQSLYKATVARPFSGEASPVASHSEANNKRSQAKPSRRIPLHRAWMISTDKFSSAGHNFLEERFRGAIFLCRPNAAQ